MRDVTRYFSAVGDLLLPRHCCVCGTVLGTEERTVCLGCLADMPLTRHWTAAENDMSTRFNALIADNPDMRRDGGEVLPYVRAAALFRFSKENGYTHICYNLKYGRDLSGGRFFAGMLGDRLGSDLWFRHADAVVPVPLHWTRRLRRGYNQSEVIAAELARKLGVRMLPDLLVRIRRTQTQTRLDVAAKRLNVAGAFAVNPKYAPLCPRGEGSTMTEVQGSQRVRKAKEETEKSKVRSKAVQRGWNLENRRGRKAKGGSGDNKGRPKMDLGQPPIRRIILVDDLFTTGATLLNCYKAVVQYFGTDVQVGIATLAVV